MAKASKSKKTKSKAKKEKTSTKKVVKKNVLETKTKSKTKKKDKEPIVLKEESIKKENKKTKKEIIDNKTSEIKKESKEKKVKELKSKPKKEKVKKDKPKKLNKKIKNKIIRLAIITVILAVSLVLLFIENKNSYTNNVSFVTKNNITTKSFNSKFQAPVYSFAIDKKNNPVEVEGLSFLDKDITYTFHDIERKELDDDNVLISIPCDMEVELEYAVGEDVDTNWVYTYTYAPVFAFDYYTGDIYHVNTISDSNLVLLGGEEKKSTKDKKKSEKEDQMAYTKIEFGDKKVNIGVLNNSTKSSWGSNTYQGNKEDGKHFKVSNKSSIVLYIKAPKKYDGMMLAINKNGATKETWKNEYDTYTKIESLKQEEKKTGEKSKELEKLENESKKIHKLIDSKDELRKDYSKDDFYIIRVADAFKDSYLIKEESNINLLYITGILVLTLAVLTCIFMMIGERNKAYGKRGY